MDEIEPKSNRSERWLLRIFILSAIFAAYTYFNLHIESKIRQKVDPAAPAMQEVIRADMVVRQKAILERSFSLKSQTSESTVVTFTLVSPPGTMTCSVNKKTPVSCSSPFIIKSDLTPLGKQTLTVNVANKGGGTVSANYTWIVMPSPTPAPTPRATPRPTPKPTPIPSPRPTPQTTPTPIPEPTETPPPSRW